MEYCPAPKIIAVNKYLLNIYYVPGTVIATGHLAVNKSPVVFGAYIQVNTNSEWKINQSINQLGHNLSIKKKN